MSLTPLAVKDRRGEGGYMQSHSRDATVAKSVAKRLLPHFVKYAESHFVKYAQPQSRSDWYTPCDKYAES